LNLTRHQLDTVHIHPDSISRTLTKAALPAKMRIAGHALAIFQDRPIVAQLEAICLQESWVKSGLTGSH